MLWGPGGGGAPKRVHVYGSVAIIIYVGAIIVFSKSFNIHNVRSRVKVSRDEEADISLS